MLIFFLLLDFTTGASCRAASPESHAACGNQSVNGCDDEWSPTEKAAWERISKGEIHDLNTGCQLDAKVKKHWQSVREGRRLRSCFLETILLDPDCRLKIPHQGVHLRGALFEDDLDLSNSELKHRLVLEDCRFEAGVDLSGLSSHQELSFKGSFIGNGLTLAGADLGGDLLIDGGEYDAPDLRMVSVTGQVLMDRSTFHGDTLMQGLQVGSQLSAQEAAFDGDVALQGTHIQKQVNFEKSTFKGELALQGARIFRRLSMKEASVCRELKSQGAKIDGDVILSGGNFTKLDFTTMEIEGQLFLNNANFSRDADLFGIEVSDRVILDGARCQGELHLQRARMGSSLSMREADFSGTVSLKAAEISGDLYTDRATFHKDLVLHRVRVGGELIFKGGSFLGLTSIDLAKLDSLVYKGTKKLAFLDLSGTEVNKVRVEVGQKEDWPENLSLLGFTYDLFFGEYKGEDNLQRKEDFFQAWLEKLKEYSPQPYEQCASVLRKAGHPERADDVLYAGKEVERHEAWKNENIKRWLWLSTLDLTIGYGLGFHYFRALGWFLFLLIAGTFVCWKDAPSDLEDDKKVNQGLNCLFYSLDMLIPLIKLRSKHYSDEMDLSGWPRYYFYFHQLAGWLLLFFILAGLSGITQM